MKLPEVGFVSKSKAMTGSGVESGPMDLLVLRPGELTLDELAEVAAGRRRLVLTEPLVAKMQAGADLIANRLATGCTVYGVNTGFGRLAQTMINDRQILALQRRLVLSHACGTGAPLSDEIVRLVMVLKAASLATGRSGVRLTLVETIADLFNAGLLPVIPSKGSVGASGDLAPLAHLACVLIGEGKVRTPEGPVIPGIDALHRIGREPLELGPKEGLALLNGTQVSTAIALSGLFAARRVVFKALVSGALTLEAVAGSFEPFDARIHKARGQTGQIAVARCLRALHKGSRRGRGAPRRIQDPYSLRCIPQVMGACVDNLAFAARTLEIEANAASDNPLVFAESDAVLSGGNFHAEPVAFAADIIALALAETGAIAERRIAMMLDSGMSGLPPFLVRDSGVNSGFMIAQVTAAALASENKSLAHPASVDSLPTSANQEDHVSMATYAALRLSQMAGNVATIIGIEAMAACQGLDLGDASDRLGPRLAQEYAAVRARIAHLHEDRYMAGDIESARDWALECASSSASASIAGLAAELWAWTALARRR